MDSLKQELKEELIANMKRKQLKDELLKEIREELHLDKDAVTKEESLFSQYPLITWALVSLQMIVISKIIH